MFAFSFVKKTSFSLERTLRRWSLSVHFLTEPESRNFFRSLLIELLHSNLYQKIHELLL